MILINLYGGPGSGKSTGASYIFSKLKMRGVNAELVSEFAKDKTWEHNTKALSNQAYMFGKQYYKITRCMDQVDVIVTDSPLLLSMIYNNDAVLGKDFNGVVYRVAKSFNSFDYFVNRVKKYNPVGRNQNEDEAKQLCDRIESMLKVFVPNYKTIDGDEEGYNKIIFDIMQYLAFAKEGVK